MCVSESEEVTETDCFTCTLIARLLSNFCFWRKRCSVMRQVAFSANESVDSVKITLLSTVHSIPEVLEERERDQAEILIEHCRHEESNCYGIRIACQVPGEIFSEAKQEQ